MSEAIPGGCGRITFVLRDFACIRAAARQTGKILALWKGLTMPRFAALLLTLIVVAPASAQDAKPPPMQIDDLFRFKRLSDPQISPDGKWVVYVQGVVDIEA